MDWIFWLRVAISFVVASAVVTFASLLAERYGPRIGGIIATLPTTIVVNTLFMGLIMSPAFASDAMVQTVVMMGANSLFLALYVAAMPLGMWRAGAVALGGWALIAALLLAFPSPHIALSVGVFTVLTVASFVWLNRRVPAHVPTAKVTNTRLQVAARGLLAGALVANAQILGAFLGPVWGGVFTPAPAIFLSTMWIFHRTQGPVFASSVARSMCLSGFIPALYATLVAVAFVPLGMVWATLVAYAMAIVATLLVSESLKRVGKKPVPVEVAKAEAPVTLR